MTDPLQFLQVDAGDFAQHITLVAASLYRKITASECKIWASLQKGSGTTPSAETPNINAVIQHHQDAHNWTARAIAASELSPRSEVRTTTICHLISIADACCAINNFATIVAMVSAMTADDTHVARRVQESIEELPTMQSILERLQVLTGPGRGFIAYRRAVRDASLPCVPCLGFTLTDLRFVEKGMPDFRKDGSWNTMKDEKLDKVIAEMQRYQREPYCIVEKGDVMQLVAACLESN